MRCRYCQNYMSEVDTCKFCHFEEGNDYNPYKSDDWDILHLDEDGEWEHIQILQRLRENGIECWSADIWFDNNMAYLIDPRCDASTLARVLNLHEEVIYDGTDTGLVILNLFQEKVLRDEENAI